MIELDSLSPGVYSVRDGRGADARVLGTVRKIGHNWYAIRGGKRIGSGGNLKHRAVAIFEQFIINADTSIDADDEVRT